MQHLFGNEKIKGFCILADKLSTQITDVYAYVHLLLFLGICRHTLLNIIIRNKNGCVSLCMVQVAFKSFMLIG